MKIGVEGITDSIKPTIASSLAPYVEQVYCCSLDFATVAVLQRIYGAFNQYLISQPPPAGAFTSVMYTTNGHCSFLLPESAIGLTTKIIVLNMPRIQALQLSNRPDVHALWPTLLEELFHSLYNIQDETDVKHLVVQVLRLEFENVEFQQLYAPVVDRWGNCMFALSAQSRAKANKK